MAPAPGFEPGTKWLTATYSTAELRRNLYVICHEQQRYCVAEPTNLASEEGLATQIRQKTRVQRYRFLGVKHENAVDTRPALW